MGIYYNSCETASSYLNIVKYIDLLWRWWIRKLAHFVLDRMLWLRNTWNIFTLKKWEFLFQRFKYCQRGSFCIWQFLKRDSVCKRVWPISLVPLYYLISVHVISFLSLNTLWFWSMIYYIFLWKSRWGFYMMFEEFL